jgi:hypothetical protein
VSVLTPEKEITLAAMPAVSGSSRQTALVIRIAITLRWSGFSLFTTTCSLLEMRPDLVRRDHRVHVVTAEWKPAIEVGKDLRPCIR